MNYNVHETNVAPSAVTKFHYSNSLARANAKMVPIIASCC